MLCIFPSNPDHLQIASSASPPQRLIVERCHRWTLNGFTSLAVCQAAVACCYRSSLSSAIIFYQLRLKCLDNSSVAPQCTTEYFDPHRVGFKVSSFSFSTIVNNVGATGHKTPPATVTLHLPPSPYYRRHSCLQ
jgi:hypothetical protein